METSISLDCVLQLSSALQLAGNKACNDFFQFLINQGDTYSELSAWKKQLGEVQNEVEKILRRKEKRIHAYVADLELAENAVNQMRDTEALKMVECLALQKNVDVLRKQIGKFSKLKETLKTNRDEILAYKLISNIGFVYSTKKICGIVEKEAPVAFNLSRENLTQEQITETLWDLVLKE